MYVSVVTLINAPITRVLGKGSRPAKSRTDGGRRPARDERNNQNRDRKHETSPWRMVSRARGR